jgi:hypothetical protein
VNRRSVHIANLRIRIPRGMAGQATSLARGLGNAILRGIAESTAPESRSRSIDSATVKVRAERNADARGLQEQVVAQVAHELRKRSE